MAWTLPDPLDGTAKTKSIYIVELQAEINTKRVVIGQAPLTFIDQSEGKFFKLTAIEELKTITNQLALDYGYLGGVENASLLGRPYITITKKYGNEVCHYPIINDLRQVLELLEIILANPAFVTMKWLYKHVVPGPNAFANFAIADNPFGSYPIDIQTGVGGVCPEGPPTCPNTIAGTWDGFNVQCTDISLVYWDLTDWKEGPIGSDYNVIPGFGGSEIFDGEYFYELSGGTPDAIGVQRWKRDGSSVSKELIALFDCKFAGYAPVGERNEWKSLTVDETYVYVSGNKTSSGSAGTPKKAIFGKATKGAASTTPIVQFWYDVNSCQAEPGPIGTFGELPDQRVESHSVYFGNIYAKGGNLYVSYYDTANYRDVLGGSNGRYYYVGTCVVEITSGATGGINSPGINKLDNSAPTKAHVANPYSGPIWDPRHGPLLGQSNSYLWVRRQPNTLNYGRLSDGTFVPSIVSQTTYFATLSYGGGLLSAITQDLEGNDISSFTSFDIDTSEAYTFRGGGATAEIVVPNFVSATRTEGSPNDTIDVEVAPTPGTFTYRVRWGTITTGINFVGAELTSYDAEVAGDYSMSFTVVHGFAHYIQLELLTGQGNLLGSQVVYFPAPFPPAPVLLNVFSGPNSGDLRVNWTTGSPFVVTNGFIIVYRLVGDLGPWTSIDIGLVGGLYTITGLIPGADYDVKMKAYNDTGESSLSNMMTGTATL